MKLASHSADGKRIRQAVQNDVQPAKAEHIKTHDDEGKRIRKEDGFKRQFEVVYIDELPFAKNSEYEVLRDLVASEWSSLKSTSDRVEKSAKQKSLLEKYREFLNAYMAGGETYHNTLLFYCLVWAADVGDFDFAIVIGDYIVKTGQHFELGFKRNAITICCDEIMLKQEQAFEKDKVLTPAFLTVFEKLKTKQWRVDNVVSLGKFYRMVGRFAEESGDMKQAYDYYCEAETINPRAGVKKMIERTKALI